MDCASDSLTSYRVDRVEEAVGSMLYDLDLDSRLFMCLLCFLSSSFDHVVCFFFFFTDPPPPEFSPLPPHDPLPICPPCGPPSNESSPAALPEGAGRVRLVSPPRHGVGHRLSPSEINYRANIYGMKKLGVQRIVSV